MSIIFCQNWSSLCVFLLWNRFLINGSQIYARIHTSRRSSLEISFFILMVCQTAPIICCHHWIVFEYDVRRWTPEQPKKRLLLPLAHKKIQCIVRMITINHRWTTTRTRSTCREISPLSIFPTGNFSTEGSILTSGGHHQRQQFRTKCEEPFRPFSVEVAVSSDS